MSRTMIRPAILITLAVLFACMRAVAAPQADAAKSLQAIFLEVEGKVRWRAAESAPWKEAAVNDLVDVGAEIRTGLKSRAALRVGKNATVLVDAGTTFQLPQIVQDGETLKTLASVKTGRVDFKVDKVGFANDFKVITPQTTLSVRGTGFGVNSGALNGVEVTGARTNALNAIEIRYIANNLPYFMSGAAKTNSKQQDPAANAWMSTIGAPPVVGTIVDNGQLMQTVSQGQAGNAPTSAQWVQQQAAAQTWSEVTTVSPIQDLLQFEGNALTSKSSDQAATAAVAPRSAAIADATRLGANLEAAWDAPGEGSGARQQLQALGSQADSDVAALNTKRQQLDAAIADPTPQDAVVQARLNEMGTVDDAWNTTGGLLAQATGIVNAINALAKDVQDAAVQAQSRDTQFNALLDVANTDRSAMQSVSLASLHRSVAAYVAEVQRVSQSGNVGLGVLTQLQRSVALLQAAESRVQSAASQADAARRALDDARSVGERVLLSAALGARDRSVSIEQSAATLRTAIAANSREIERIRFAAFFAAASAAASTIQQQGGVASQNGKDAIDDATSSRTRADELAGVGAQSTGQIAQVVQLADSMEAFWSGSDRLPSGSTRKARMEGLLAESASDLSQISVTLDNLRLSADLNDMSGATLYLGDMKQLERPWLADGAIMTEVKALDDAVQSRHAGVQAAYDTAKGTHDRFEALLASADSKRQVALTAADRLNRISTAMNGYRAEYQALVAAGRGGQDAAQKLQTAIAQLQGVQGALAQGLKASQDATAAVDSAQTYGAKVFFAAAADARLKAIDIASASTALRMGIEANANAMHGKVDQGQQVVNGLAGGGNNPK